MIISKAMLCGELGFFALHSVPQDASFELSKKGFRQFFRFFIIRGDPFDLGGLKISLSRFMVVLQSKLKFFVIRESSTTLKQQMEHKKNHKSAFLSISKAQCNTLNMVFTLNLDSDDLHRTRF